VQGHFIDTPKGNAKSSEVFVKDVFMDSDTTSWCFLRPVAARRRARHIEPPSPCAAVVEKLEGTHRLLLHGRVNAEPAGRLEGTMTSVSESMKTSFTNTSELFALPLGVSMKWPCTSKMNSSFAGPTCTRASCWSSAASLGRSKKPPARPAAAFAVLKASSVLAARRRIRGTRGA